ncbi:ribonuclease III [Candidatus Peribacteria bacterium]|nr:ribonuclease III [Candidatus Peribacteria bacterium]
MQVNDYTPLYTQLGFTISNDALMTEAFTHRSVLNEKQRSSRKHNERLEFLGDAVLELVTTEFLYHRYPDAPEGEMTNYRSSVVNRLHLAAVARTLGLGDYLILSRGERASGGAEKDYLLANVVEAFIGAIYLSKGMMIARDFIHQWVLSNIDDIIDQGLHIDAKSHFQELAQAHVSVTPHYEVLQEEGLDHEKIFTVGAYLNEQQVGTGTGNSKKTAQISAAEDALTRRAHWLEG